MGGSPAVGNTTFQFNNALHLAIEAHRNQRDSWGRPRIQHSMKVASNFTSEVDVIVAMLHDVLGTGKVTMQTLIDMKLPGEVLAAIDHLTQRNGEEYWTFITRCKKNPIARRVMIASLKAKVDECNLSLKGNRTVFDRLRQTLSLLVAAQMTTAKLGLPVVD